MEDPFGEHGGTWFGDFAPAPVLPAIDVSDEDEALKVTAELPGMSKDDIEVTVADGCLTLRGEKRHDDEQREKGVYRTERFYGYVHRALPLPDDVDGDAAEASFENGVLTVRLPKVARADDSRRIEIAG